MSAEVEALVRRGYRVSEVAKMLGIGERSAWRLISSGELRSIHPTPGTTRVTPESLDDFMASRPLAGGGR